MAGGIAVGMASFASAGMKMPLSAVALTVLLFGPNASEVFPEVAIAAVTGYAVRVAIDKRREAAPAGTRSPTPLRSRALMDLPQPQAADPGTSGSPRSSAPR